MKYFSILTMILVTTLILSACGARDLATPAPTVNPVDIQSTMAAAAFTMVAETRAAIPTTTVPPPTATFTDTPPATSTFLPLASAQVTLTSEAGENSGGNDPCINQVLPATLQGKPVKMRVDNSTKATVSLTVYLNSTAPGGQCGYRSYTLAPGEFVVINNLVEGCYTLWAWNPIPEEYFIVTNGTNCLDSADDWAFDISTGSIRLR